MAALQLSPKLEIQTDDSVSMDWVDRPQSYKGLYEILQLL